MQCTWSEPGNGTLATAPAVVIGSSSIHCIAPAWQPTAPSWQVCTRTLSGNVSALPTDVGLTPLALSVAEAFRCNLLWTQ